MSGGSVNEATGFFLLLLLPTQALQNAPWFPGKSHLSVLIAQGAGQLLYQAGKSQNCTLLHRHSDLLSARRNKLYYLTVGFLELSGIFIRLFLKRRQGLGPGSVALKAMCTPGTVLKIDHMWHQGLNRGLLHASPVLRLWS